MRPPRAAPGRYYETRPPNAITSGPDGVDVYNPAFDVTPADLIAGIVTERGVIRPVDAATIRAVIAPDAATSA